MIRALIADDEAASARLLQRVLEDTGAVTILGAAHSGAECLRLCEDLAPEVLFLDIEMGDLSGLEVAAALLSSSPRPHIVFVTAHDDYALQAFDLRAVDYVVKLPDLAEFAQRLGETVTRLQASAAPGLSVEALTALLADLRSRPGPRPCRKLPVKDYREGTVRLVDPHEVLFVERRERRAVIHAHGQDFPTYYTITQLEQRLAPEGFFRVNPGVIINLQAVEHLIPLGDGSYEVLLGDPATGDTVHFDVSRSRARELFAALAV